MSLLDGDLQAMFGAAFAGLLLEGRHYRATEVRDLKGNVTATLTKVQSVIGFRERKSKVLGQAGYAPDTVVLLILQTYQGRVITAPASGEKVRLDGVLWVLGNLIEEDAAHVAWRFAATPA